MFIFTDEKLFDIDQLPVGEVKKYSEEDDLLDEIRGDLEYDICQVSSTQKTRYQKYKRRNENDSKRCCCCCS
jgi:hypothetical protein